MSKTKTVLVIGDTHLPFEHDGYLAFCKRIEKAYKCSEVIHIGDLVDNNAISYYESDPDGLSPADEMKETDDKLKLWFKAFPKVKLCRGNHDILVDRKGRTAGLPTRCFKEFRDIWKLPDTWQDDFSFVIGDVLYKHSGAGGKFGHVQTANNERMNTVIGHLHSVAGVEYTASERDIIFGMCVGCGIDRNKYAFAYGKGFARKPILSAGVVNYSPKGTSAIVVPMKM